jgi:hypothetical protein
MTSIWGSLKSVQPPRADRKLHSTLDLSNTYVVSLEIARHWPPQASGKFGAETDPGILLIGDNRRRLSQYGTS